MDSRPEQLQAYVQRTKDSNDEAIENALMMLQKKALAGELKPNKENLAALAGVSVGTISNRKWALLRLKVIKSSLKDARKDSKKTLPKTSEENPSQQARYRERIKGLLEQNALLYDELLASKEELRRAQVENTALARRLSLKQTNKQPEE